MTDIPIIFSPAMVSALLDGRKTMTRRLAWTKWITAEESKTGNAIQKSSLWARAKPGDRLYVREQHWRWGRWVRSAGTTKTGKGRWRFLKRVPFDDLPEIVFTEPERLVKRTNYGYHKRPSIFLEREASRLTLVVTSTKVEPLQSISERDVRAEGVEVRQFALFGADAEGRQKIAASHFGHLWTTLHGKDSWDANPEVVALTFSVARRNIDAVEAA